MRKMVDNVMVKELENERDNHLFQADQASERRKRHRLVRPSPMW